MVYILHMSQENRHCVRDYHVGNASIVSLGEMFVEKKSKIGLVKEATS